jgi:flagellar protein FliL
MAKKKKDAEGAEGAEGKKKGSFFKSKKFIIVVVLLLVGGGVGYKMTRPKPKPGPPVAGATVKLAPNIVNLADGHYLKVGVAVELVEGKGTPAKFNTNQAAQIVIDEFTGRSRATMDNAMRHRLEKELEDNMKKAYPGEVFGLFFNTFLID